MKRQLIDLDKLRSNTGQIPGLPKNPRSIKDDRYEKLLKSLQDDPEMLELRELIVFPDGDLYLVIAGNMRLLAMRELRVKEAPCKILPADTPTEKLRAYTIKDNVAYGDNDWEALANEWDQEELITWGMQIPDFGPLEEDDKSDNIQQGFKIEVELENETEQEKLYNDLIEKGYSCRILTL